MKKTTKNRLNHSKESLSALSLEMLARITSSLAGFKIEKKKPAKRKKKRAS